MVCFPPVCLFTLYSSVSRACKQPDIHTPLIHSLVLCFIEDDPFFHYLGFKDILFLQRNDQIRRPDHEEVQRERVVNSCRNTGGGMKWVFLRQHNDKQVHIAILRRLAIGVGTEEDHLLWVKLLDNLSSHSSYPFKDCGRDSHVLF